ncbi:MAG TPA: vWA domain-containing protein [Candidatus Thermoplasmatota archaeon]|nr:vWA domain-containing protein [Candidatus Thermoplasmatota archaeon]
MAADPVGSDDSAARSLVLRPLDDCPAERRPAAARAALRAATGRALRVGDLVTAEGVSFVVHKATIADAAALEFDFGPGPERRPIADVLFLLDASYSMSRADLPPTRLEAVERALVTGLANASDIVRRASIVAFTGEPWLVAPFATPSSLDVAALDAFEPRGPGDVLRALDHALETMTREADVHDAHVIALATDSAMPVGATADVAARATRLGIQVHVLDAGSSSPQVLERLAATTGGTYHDAFGGVTFRPALQALAHRFGVPLPWRDPARSEGEVEFEVVLRAMTERESSEFPALPRRLNRR